MDNSRLSFRLAITFLTQLKPPTSKMHQTPEQMTEITIVCWKGDVPGSICPMSPHDNVLIPKCIRIRAFKGLSTRRQERHPVPEHFWLLQPLGNPTYFSPRTASDMIIQPGSASCERQDIFTIRCRRGSGCKWSRCRFTVWRRGRR